MVVQSGALQQIFWHSFVGLVQRIGNQGLNAPQAFCKGNYLYLSQNSFGHFWLGYLEGNHGTAAGGLLTVQFIAGMVRQSHIVYMGNNILLTEPLGNALGVFLLALHADA